MCHDSPLNNVNEKSQLATFSLSNYIPTELL